jgi:hypothetical protein
MRYAVSINEKQPDGSIKTTAARFIPTDLLVRIGGYQTPDSLRQKLWRLEHPERVTEHKRAFQERQRQRREEG